MDNPILKINFELLKEQYNILDNLGVTHRVTPEESSTIEGILNLLDYIKDYAVEELGMPEDKVFIKTKVD